MSPVQQKFTTRHIQKHLTNLEKELKKFVDKNKNTKEIVWYITHGIIIKQISEIVGIKTSKQFPYLSCLNVNETPDLIRCEFLMFKGELISEKEETKHYYRNSKGNRSKDGINRFVGIKRDDMLFKK
jgi:hypothetical protein